jgi:hypothetical protein
MISKLTIKSNWKLFLGRASALCDCLAPRVRQQKAARYAKAGAANRSAARSRLGLGRDDSPCLCVRPSRSNVVAAGGGVVLFDDRRAIGAVSAAKKANTHAEALAVGAAAQGKIVDDGRAL